MKTTVNDAVLKDISLVKLSTRREKQILLYYYKIMFGIASPTLQPIISKMYKDLSPYILRNSLDVQIPLAKKNILLNSFFRKAASLWNALPVVVKTSASFLSFKLRLETFYSGSKCNSWHFHGSDLRSTSLRSYAVDRAWSQCPKPEQAHLTLMFTCNKETEQHLLLNVLLTICEINFIEGRSARFIVKCVIRPFKTVATSTIWTSFA